MKFTTIIAALAASAVAAPASSPANTLKERTFKCPANSAQPNGKLPKNAINSELVQISAKKADKAFPVSEWAKITPKDFCTIFTLELPVAGTQGKVCNLVFDFPSFLQAPFLFTFFGPGHFIFTGYDIGVGAVPGETTYNNQPRLGPNPPNPPPVMKPGNSYIINSAPCGIPANIPAPIVKVSGSLCSKDTTLIFKQSNKICPLGFYVILTDP